MNKYFLEFGNHEERLSRLKEERKMFIENSDDYNKRKGIVSNLKNNNDMGNSIIIDSLQQ